MAHNDTEFHDLFGENEEVVTDIVFRQPGRQVEDDEFHNSEDEVE
jgi:hypothetical protein